MPLFGRKKTLVTPPVRDDIAMDDDDLASRQQAAVAEAVAGIRATDPSADDAPAPAPAPAQARPAAAPGAVPPRPVRSRPAAAVGPERQIAPPAAGITVRLPTGEIAAFPWQALTPSGLSPLYRKLDDDILRSLLARDPGDVLDPWGAALEYIAPDNHAREELTYYMLGTRFYTTLFVKRWPRRAGAFSFRPGNWGRFFGPDAQVSVHFYRQPRVFAEKDASESITTLELKIEGMRKGVGHATESQIADVEERIRVLRAHKAQVVGNEVTAFHISAYMRIGADTFADLQKSVRRVKEIGEPVGIVFGEAHLQQRDAMLSSLPLGWDPTYKTQTVSSREAAGLFPFIDRDHVEPAGILYGIHQMTHSPVVVDPFDPAPSRTTVLGEPNSGKTYWIRCHLNRLAMTGVKVVVIDPMNDYALWAANNGGQVIRIAPDSANHINPLRRIWTEHLNDSGDVVREWESVASKVSALQPIFRLLLGNASYDAGSFDLLLSNALSSFYARFGTEERLMSDFVDHLTEMNRDNTSGFGPDILVKRQSLIDAIRLKMTEGHLQEFFGHPTDVDIRSDRVVFSLIGLTGDDLAFAAYLSLTMARQIMSATLGRKILVVDEIHRLLAISDAAVGVQNTFKDFNKTHRHWSAALLYATQWVEGDAVVNTAQRDVLANSTSDWVLLRSTPTNLGRTAEIVTTVDAKILQDTLASTDAGGDLRPVMLAIQHKGVAIPMWSVGFAFEDRDNDPNSAHRATT